VAERIRDTERPHVALYVGGMGSEEQNFYNDLFVRYGYREEAAQIQQLYRAGRRDQAAARVPPEYLRSTSLVGDEGHIRDRIAAYESAGVTCLNVDLHESNQDPLRLIDKLRAWSGPE
jgi:alkanesulfonate monooxygenase SsuD/methylene tetrahydromethanopterin reductase-like flavin-dependent oxidoreductase (luciferase family)